MNRLLLSAALLAALATPSLADDLFVISGTSNGSPITPVGADNLINLVNDAVNNAGAFTALANTNASLSLSYGGISNAISVDKNSANTFATLSFINADGSRTTRTFDTTAPGANGRSLQQLIEDYLKKGGSADLKEFFKAINARSIIAVSDGNPNATTARMADQVYNRFGRYNRQTTMWVAGGKQGDINDSILGERVGEAPQLRIGVSGDTYTAGGFSGNSAAIETSFDWNFSPRVGVSLGTFAAFTSIGSANVYHAGADVGVPIRPVLPTASVPLTWQITPSFSVAGSGSEDTASGGLIYSPAATSLLRWDITQKFALEMANQIGYYAGEKLTFGSYSIDPGVKQTIVKNGLEAQVNLGAAGWYAYGGASYTNFLDNAAVKGYLTPDVGIGWRNPSLRGTSIELGFVGSFGDSFSSYGGRLLFNIAF